MAWVDLDDFVFLTTRTTADKYSAADMNSVDDNLTQIRDNLALILGANTQPTRDIATMETDLATVEADVAGVGIPYQRYGLTLSNAADTDHDITIAAGRCSSSAFDTMLILASAMTKRIDAGWSAGDTNGGLFSGAVGNNTWYYVHVIKKDSDGSIDAGFDTSATAANKPAGYTYYRCIGAVKTNGSANIYNFKHFKSRFYFNDPILDINVTDLGTSAVNYTISVPPNSIAFLNAAISKTGDSPYAYISSTYNSDSAPSLTAAPLATIRPVTDSIISVSQVSVLADASSQIRARGSAASLVFKVATLGFEMDI